MSSKDSINKNNKTLQTCITSKLARISFNLTFQIQLNKKIWFKEHLQIMLSGFLFLISVNQIFNVLTNEQKRYNATLRTHSILQNLDMNQYTINVCKLNLYWDY
jgi:hypothetical protein